jgi:hypothetical protein
MSVAAGVQMKNLVMGFSTNQDERSLRLFCASLRKIYSPEQCDLVIITDRYEEYCTDLARYGVQFISTTNSYPGTNGKLARALKKIIVSGMLKATQIKLFNKSAPEIMSVYPVLLESWLHPCSVRWFAYERFLTLNRLYSQVFISDVRDVIFQAPVFDGEPGDRVSLFEQDEIYGTADCDTNWYRDSWGESELAKVIGKEAVCMGTILGPHREVLSLVSEFCTFFKLHPYTGTDQCLFNYMIQNDLVRTPYRVVENVSGPVATLSNQIAHDATVTSDGYVRRAIDGSIIPAVHMYDRWPDTRALSAQ